MDSHVAASWGIYNLNEILGAQVLQIFRVLKYL